jgi:hypothetical protein
LIDIAMSEAPAAPERAFMYWTGRHLGLPTGNTKHNVAYVREDIAQAQIGAAVKAERERCAKVAETYPERAFGGGPWVDAARVAAAIRKGEQP